MRRTWLWSVPIVIAGGAAWLASLGLRPACPMDDLVRAAGFAALALALELAWRGSSSRTPIYRRHLVLFGLLALAGAAAETRRAGDLLGWLADLAGTILGLAL